MSVGRNELCPCGSGKKYKKCCGVVTPITELRSIHEQRLRKEYAGWIDRLNNYVSSQFSNETVHQSRQQFAQEIGLNLDYVMRPEWIAHFFNWYVLDVQVNGTTAIESFMKQQGRKMESDLRRAFSQLYLGLYEIEQVEKEVYTTVDLVTKEKRYVLRTNGFEAQVGQIIAGRLLNVGLRNLLFSGSVVLQAHMKPDLLEWIEQHPDMHKTAELIHRTYTTALYSFIVEFGEEAVETRQGDVFRRVYRNIDTSELRKSIETDQSFELKKREGSKEFWVYATRREEHLFPALQDALLELHEVLAEVIIQADSVWVEGFLAHLEEVAVALRLPSTSEQISIQKLTSTGTKLTHGTLFITSEPTLPPRVLQWAVQAYFAEKWLVTPHDSLDHLAPTLIAASGNNELVTSLVALVEQIEQDSKLGQGLARFMRIDALRPRLALANKSLHVSNLLSRPLIEGLPESVYTVHPDLLADITHFVQEMTDGKSEATVKKYDEVMNTFRSFIRGAFGPRFFWDQLRREDVAYFLVHDIFGRVDAPTKTLGTNLLSVLVAFFKWLDKERKTDLTTVMQPLLNELKEYLPEAYRVRHLLQKEANQNLFNSSLAPKSVSEEHLILVEQKAESWVLKRQDGEEMHLHIDDQIVPLLAPDWVIAGLIGQAGDGRYHLYAVPELYPPAVAHLLGAELTVLV